MYADDVTIIVPGKDRTEVIKTANNGMNSVCSWLENHKLVVNTQKPKFMILSTKPYLIV